MGVKAYCETELAKFSPAPGEGGIIGAPSGTVALACGLGARGKRGEEMMMRRLWYRSRMAVANEGIHLDAPQNE